jgi:hypothetical protein
MGFEENISVIIDVTTANLGTAIHFSRYFFLHLFHTPHGLNDGR